MLCPGHCCVPCAPTNDKDMLHLSTPINRTAVHTHFSLNTSGGKRQVTAVKIVCSGFSTACVYAHYEVDALTGSGQEANKINTQRVGRVVSFSVPALKLMEGFTLS